MAVKKAAGKTAKIRPSEKKTARKRHIGEKIDGETIGVKRLSGENL